MNLNLKTFLVVFIGFVWLVGALAVYSYFFRSHQISDNPEHWAHFATYFGSVILAPLTFVATIFAAYHVFQNLKLDSAIGECDIYRERLSRLLISFDTKLAYKRSGKFLNREGTEGLNTEELLLFYQTRFSDSSAQEQKQITKLATSIVGQLDAIVSCSRMYSKMVNDKLLSSSTKEEREGQASTEAMILLLKYTNISIAARKILTEDQYVERKHFVSLFVDEDASFISSITGELN